MVRAVNSLEDIIASKQTLVDLPQKVRPTATASEILKLGSILEHKVTFCIRKFVEVWRQ
jgi:hypothetical protein